MTKQQPTRGGSGEIQGSDGAGDKPGTAMRPLAIIVPTRGRPQNVGRLLALDNTTEADFWFCVDNDDPELAAYKAIADESVDSEHTFVFGPPKRLVPWINEVSKTLIEDGEYHYIGFIGDDHLPRTKKWDQRICETLYKLKTGMCYTNDLLQCEKLPTVCFMTTDIIETLGYMAPPSLVHMFVDNFWLDLGRAVRRIRYLPDVVIEHLHPIAGKAEMDASYETTTPMMATDQVAYQRYKAEQFYNDVVKLESLIGATA